VLGKGTHDLEGFELEGKGYFGPGELPAFDRGFFDMPRGTIEDFAFENFKDQAKASGGEVTEEMIDQLKAEMSKAGSQQYDAIAMLDEAIDIDADYI